MEFHHLRTFVAVAEEGNLTRASERLFTSQPAISAHVKALEEELGARLFERTPRGMSLTEAGERLLEEARAALDALGRVGQTARSLRGRVIGAARVGLNTDSAYLKVSEFHRRLTEAHPDLRLELIQDISGRIVDAVRGGRLDAGFFFGRPMGSELATLKLEDAPLRIAAPAHWRERVLGADLPALAELPWIFPSEQCPYMQVMQELFPAGGPQPSKVVIASGESAMNALVASGAGLTLIREDEARQGVDESNIVLLKGHCYSLRLCFGFLANRAEDPMIEALVTTVQGAWDTMDKPVLAASQIG